MASPNLSEMTVTTLRNRSKTLADNVTRNNAIWSVLTDKGRVRPLSGGRTIEEGLTYANNVTYTRFSGYDPLNTTPSDVITGAEYPWRQAAVAISYNSMEELQNAGAERAIPLVASRIDNAMATFKNGLSYDAYSDGTQSGQINGLAHLISTTPATGIVGGIDRANYPFWRNQVFAGVADGGSAVSGANILNYMNILMARMVRGTDSPDIAIADANFFTMFQSALFAIQRITKSGSATGGFTSLAYAGVGKEIDVMLDGGWQGAVGDGNNFGPGGIGALGGMAASRMYMINTNHLSLRPHTQMNMTQIGPQRQSVNQAATIILYGWAGNMTINNGFGHGVLIA